MKPRVREDRVPDRFGLGGVIRRATFAAVAFVSGWFLLILTIALLALRG